jgi:dipicolinate synthase subunit A
LPSALLVDLSTKGGFDLEFAKSLGIKTLKAPALPGKTAPKTAGKILAKTVSDLIRFYN